MSIQVGFIRTGLMGFPMAKNILKSGYKLKVFSRTISKAEPLREFGASVKNSLSDVVKDQDLIITMLTADGAILQSIKRGFSTDKSMLIPLYLLNTNSLNFLIFETSIEKPPAIL